VEKSRASLDLNPALVVWVQCSYCMVVGDLHLSIQSWSIATFYVCYYGDVYLIKIVD
jgi:hypothetical protein